MFLSDCKKIRCLTVSAKCRMMKAVLERRGLLKCGFWFWCRSYSFWAQLSSDPLGIYDWTWRTVRHKPQPIPGTEPKHYH